MLWSHYADRHRVAWLSFDVPDEDARVVDYTADRLELADDTAAIGDGASSSG